MEKEQEVTEVLNEEAKSFDTLIEEKRAPLYQRFLSSRKISNILTFVILIAAVGGMILIPNEALWMKILGWCLIGAGLAGMICFYFFSKKRFDVGTREYIDFVNATLNHETFSDPNFTDIEVTDGKLEIENFAGNGVYSEIVRVASRNVINGKYCDIPFKFAEAALFKKPEGKKGPVSASFVGKFFEVENTIKFGGNIVINISREQPVDAPNGLGDKTALYTDDGLTIYGIEGTEFRDVIGEEFVGKIRKIKAENHLLNLAISIWEGHTFVFMSYDDDVIALPFDKPLKPEAFLSFVGDLKKVFETIKLLGK